MRTQNIAIFNDDGWKEIFFSSHLLKNIFVKQHIVLKFVLRCDGDGIFLYMLLLLMCPYVVLVHSATERRSRLHFMHQWSQVGHNKRRKISREELEKWAESLNTLLASQSEFYLMKHFLKAEIVPLTKLISQLAQL